MDDDIVKAKKQRFASGTHLTETFENLECIMYTIDCGKGNT